MSMFTIVDTRIDSWNAMFQINAKYDCIKLCMLLYHEYFFFYSHQSICGQQACSGAQSSSSLVTREVHGILK